MKKEIVINATTSEMRVALLEDDRLAEIFLEVADKESRIGSIYIGRVQRVVQGMNAAFVDIGEEQHAFLHFSDVGNALDDLLDDGDDDGDDDDLDDESDEDEGKHDVKGKPPRGKQPGGRPEGKQQPPQGRNQREEGKRPHDRDQRRGDRRDRPRGPEESGEMPGGAEHAPSDLEGESLPPTLDEGRITPESSDGREREQRGGRHDRNRDRDRDRRDGRRDGRRDRHPADRDRSEAGQQTSLPFDGDSTHTPSDLDTHFPSDHPTDAPIHSDDDFTGEDEGMHSEGGQEETSEERKKRRRRRRGGRGRGRRNREGGEGIEGSQSEGGPGDGGHPADAREGSGRPDDRDRPRRDERRNEPRPERTGDRQNNEVRGDRSHEPRPERGDERRNDPRAERQHEPRPERRGDRPNDQRPEREHERGERRNEPRAERSNEPRPGRQHEAGTEPSPAAGEQPAGRDRREREPRPPRREEPRSDAPASTHTPEHAPAPQSQTGEGEHTGRVEPREERPRRDDGRRGKRPPRGRDPQVGGESGEMRPHDAPEHSAPAAERGVEPRDSAETRPEAPAPEGAPARRERPLRREPRRERPPRAEKPEGSPAPQAEERPVRAIEPTEGDRPAPAAPEKRGDAPGTEGEAPARSPRPQRRAPRRGGKRGPDDASEGGSGTMDAKLPTFQTKRSGEVTIALEKGQDVIVQVTRESYAQKGVRVSTKVSLPGRFLVLLPLDPSIGISRKVQFTKERRRLRRIAKSILPEGYGCIIRTNAQNKDGELIRQDLMKLIENWRGIEETLKQVQPPALLYRDQSVANTVMRDLFTPDVTRVIIDNPGLYKQIRDYVEWAAPGISDKIVMYDEDTPIFEKYGVEQELERMFQRRIYLPSGGYIILDQTEAMMVIDVNSGRFADKQEQEITSLRTNVEAAREIARQIRLRDIGGLLVVDFIDLYEEKNRKKIYDELKKEMRKDRAKSVVLPMTQFGLVQMTRQRIRQQVLHTISEPCPTCAGSGVVQSKSTVVRRMERWLNRFKDNSREFRLMLKANPVIIDYLTEGGSLSRLTKMMVKHFVRIKVVPDESIPVEEFHFVSYRQQVDITEKFLTKDGR